MDIEDLIELGWEPFSYGVFRLQNEHGIYLLYVDDMNVECNIRISRGGGEIYNGVQILTAQWVKHYMQLLGISKGESMEGWSNCKFTIKEIRESLNTIRIPAWKIIAIEESLERIFNERK